MRTARPLAIPLQSSRRTARRPAFTLRELGFVVAAIAVLSAVAIPLISSSRRRQREHQNQQQLRNLVQSCLIFSDSSSFPFPSHIDRANATVSAPARSKDTPGNVASALIWYGAISPEVTISPLETNPSIQACLQYHNANPTAAADPANACWDPSFSADFTSGHIGNLSYALLQLSGTYSISVARPVTDPTIHPGNFAGGRVIDPSSGRISLIVKGLGWQQDVPLWADRAHRPIGSSPLPYRGQIGYADGHVALESSDTFPAGLTYNNALGVKTPDHPFLDEPDDPTGTNVYLGIFTTAGENPADFTPIWD